MALKPKLTKQAKALRKERKAKRRAEAKANGPVVAKPSKAAKSKHGVAPELIAALERWKGGASLTVEAREVGLSKAKLRKAWADHLGGYDKLHELRKQGAGSHVAFGGKRHVFKKGEGKGEKMRPDDSKVVHIKSTKGWPARTVYQSTMVKIEGVGTVAARERVCYVYKSPKTGKEYTPAGTMERADLIVTWPGLNLPPGRLRRFEGSKAERAVRKLARHEAELGKREEAKEKEARRLEREARIAEKKAKRDARQTKLKAKELTTKAPSKKPPQKKGKSAKRHK